MEYPCLVYINKELDNNERLWTIVHETAHQWWYALVGNDQIKESCLDEGLAEYSTAQFFNAYPKYNISAKYDQVLKGTQYLKFKEIYKNLYGVDYNFSALRELSQFKNSTDYVNTIYNYTPYFLTEFSAMQNEGEFNKKLSYFAYKYAYKTAKVQNLIQIFDMQQQIYLKNAFLGRAVIN